jgi:N-acetylmuramic acid 6-phosphate etherase
MSDPRPEHTQREEPSRSPADAFPTEAILEDARDLDQRSVLDVLELIHREDANAHAAVGHVRPQIAEAVEVLATTIAGGGTWYNVGAGTSGRLGVLDASEIPPTYGMNPRIVQGVIAGGERALRNAVEGAEDDRERGIFELNERGLTLGDAVVAISASGRTPYVLGAIEAAHAAGARTIGISCDPNSALAESVEIAISPLVGPEVIAGSTRMKGGLAQKMVLASLSTAVMVKLGKVTGNLMTQIAPVSSKLRGRAVRIVMSLTDVHRDEARRLLRETDGCVEAAVQMARRAG